MLFPTAALLALVAAAPAPTPTASPLKTITHEHVSALCTNLHRFIGPAIGHVLQNDALIANSKPLFHTFAQAAAIGQSQAAQDLAVSKLESLIGPLVKNTEAIDALLSNPYVFPRLASSSGDRALLKLRAQLEAVNTQQKHALDVISGFVDTQQLGELQSAGHDYDSALSVNPNVPKNDPKPAPSVPDIYKAGAGGGIANDSIAKNDPRFQNTDALVGHNPLDAFSQAIAAYQSQIGASEQAVAKSVMDAVPACGATPAP